MSNKIKTAKKFLNKIKNSNPDLYNLLVKQAEFFLTKDKHEYTPTDLKEPFKNQLASNPELDPTLNPDTYGIKLAIDSVADNKKDASSAKRLFNYTLDQVFKEEISSNEIFGKYLFGQERDLPNKQQREPNTEKENELFHALNRHYHGNPDYLDKWLKTMVNLINQGKYTDILKVPDKYQYAYRLMVNIDINLLSDLTGLDFEDIINMSDNELHSVNGGIYLATNEHASWTVEPNVFNKILNDWKSFYSEESKGYLVFFKAPIKENIFLLNPDATEIASDKWHYQKEIISVGDIKCDKIWFISNKCKDEEELYNMEKSAANQIVNLNQSVQENLYHLSKNPIKNTETISNKEQETDHKPIGLWYSCDHEWLDWVRIEMPEWEHNNYYDVKINYDNVLQIKTLEELFAFNKKYSDGYSMIDWKKVSLDYDGIEICPYQEKAKFNRNMLWYYTWDIASGCIWNKNAILEMKPVSKPDKKSLDEDLLPEEEWKRGGVRFFQMGDSLPKKLKNAPAHSKKPLNKR